jgi:exosortase
LLLAGAAAFAFIESVTNLGLAGAVGLVLAVPGMSLLLFGMDVTRRIAFPLALVVFLIPVPEELVDPLYLPTVSAILAEPMLRALDVPILRDQTALILPVSSFGVSANCSGLSTFYSGLLVALVLARFATSWAKRVVLVAAVWPVTVIVNSFRVTFLVGSSNAIGIGWFESPVHGMSGILSFWITIGLLFAIGMREMRRTIST